METLTYIMHIESQILVLEKRVVIEATSLNLLEEGADIPAVEDIQQHDARHPQGHVQHCLQFLLGSHVFSWSRPKIQEIQYKRVSHLKQLLDILL